jgi:hypothetical protein
VRPAGHAEGVEDPHDYSPFRERAGEAEKRRKHRMFWGVVGGMHLLWIYAAILAGLILLVVYLTAGFG